MRVILQGASWARCEVLSLHLHENCRVLRINGSVPYVLEIKEKLYGKSDRTGNLQAEIKIALGIQKDSLCTEKERAIFFYTFVSRKLLIVEKFANKTIFIQLK